MRPYILHFAHDNIRRFAGGLAKYIQEESGLARTRGVESAAVFPLGFRQFPGLSNWARRGWCVCRGEGWKWIGVYGWRDFAKLLGHWERGGWGLAEIQLHHIGMYDSDDLRRFLAEVPARVRLFLHDYHTVCPSTQLLRNGKEHCGTAAPCAEKCTGCRHWNAKWLPGMKETLAGLGERLRVTAPSESVARGWLESWPEFRGRVEVIPHWVATRTARGPGREVGTRLRVAFAGVQLGHKGWDVWCRAVAAARASKVAVDFLYFGLDTEVPEGVRAVRVAYGELTEALRHERVNVLCQWSMVPETYSYVYFEAAQAGTWVVAPPMSGNIADAIRKTGWGTVLADEAALAAFLQDEARMRATLAAAREVERPAEMAVNSQVVDELPAARPLGLPAGRPHRSWPREMAWKLKDWTGHA